MAVLREAVGEFVNERTPYRVGSVFATEVELLGRGKSQTRAAVRVQDVGGCRYGLGTGYVGYHNLVLVNAGPGIFFLVCELHRSNRCAFVDTEVVQRLVELAGVAVTLQVEECVVADVLALDAVGVVALQQEADGVLVVVLLFFLVKIGDMLQGDGQLGCCAGGIAGDGHHRFVARHLVELGVGETSEHLIIYGVGLGVLLFVDEDFDRGCVVGEVAGGGVLCGAGGDYLFYLVGGDFGPVGAVVAAQQAETLGLVVLGDVFEARGPAVLHLHVVGAIVDVVERGGEGYVVDEEVGTVIDAGCLGVAVDFAQLLADVAVVGEPDQHIGLDGVVVALAAHHCGVGASGNRGAVVADGEDAAAKHLRVSVFDVFAKLVIGVFNRGSKLLVSLV